MISRLTRVAALAAACTAVVLIVTPREPKPLKPAMNHAVKPAAGRLPLSFEPNRGQTHEKVDYLARGTGYTLFLTGKEVVLSLSGPAKSV